jgi:hypothetical protein
MYSCTLSLTSALDGVDGQRYALARKTQYPWCRKLVVPQGWSEWGWKISQFYPKSGVGNHQQHVIKIIIFHSHIAYL